MSPMTIEKGSIGSEIYNDTISIYTCSLEINVFYLSRVYFCLDNDLISAVRDN